jgi:ankyrin repeat protein
MYNQNDFALLRAIDEGDAKAVAACLKVKKDTAFYLNDRGSTYLHYAVQLRNLDVVSALLDSACILSILNVFDDTSATPLITAVKNDALEIAKILIDKGADINAHDENTAGNTAINEAVECASPEFVEYLLASGADPTIRGWMQMNAIDRAIKCSKRNPSKENLRILKAVRSFKIGHI